MREAGASSTDWLAGGPGHTLRDQRTGLWLVVGLGWGEGSQDRASGCRREWLLLCGPLSKSLSLFEPPHLEKGG